MKTRYIDANEVRALRDAMSDDAWLPFEVSIVAGLRIGDVLKIKHSDIDTCDLLHYVAQKTGKSGTVKLPRGLALRLRADNGSVWVFPSRRQGSACHLTRQAAWARVKAAARRAGVNLAGCAPHSFRKVFAVELFARCGADAVREALQHSDIRTTEIYALSDFVSGDNARLPLLRGDLAVIAERVADIVIARLNL